MKVAVAYYSMTKHSKKIAQAVAKALDTEALNIKAKPQLKQVELLFVVGGIYGGNSSPDLIGFVESINKEDVKKAALITSCVSEKYKQDQIREALEKNEIEVVSKEYVCKGNFLLFGLGHPNKEEIEGAVSFAKSTLSELN